MSRWQATLYEELPSKSRRSKHSAEPRASKSKKSSRTRSRKGRRSEDGHARDTPIAAAGADAMREEAAAARAAAAAARVAARVVAC